METEVKIKILREGAAVPKIATKGSAAADLCACIEESVTIQPGETALLPTGFAMEVPVGFAAFIFARSGLGIKHGISPANCVGVIDSDYRGEVCVGLHNFSKEAYTVNPGDRVAQMAVMPVAAVNYVAADELDSTERGKGGFGSTGK